jgi:hypothetical protein
MDIQDSKIHPIMMARSRVGDFSPFGHLLINFLLPQSKYIFCHLLC